MGMKRLLALALALCLCLSILPGAAWETTSGTIGESHVSWSFDEASGRLTISGSGGCEAFENAEDQPWAALRTEIREVWFYDQADLAIENLAYWFTDCVNLTLAEVPYTTSIIGEAAFAGCPSLVRILLYYNDEQAFTIAPGAFYTDTAAEIGIYYPAQCESVSAKLAALDWEAENRTVTWYDVYTAMAIPYCYEGGNAHQGDFFNKHWITSCKYSVSCKWCGAYLGEYEQHSYVYGVCERCGKTNGSSSGGGGGTSCSHTSTRMVYTPYSETQHSYEKLCNSCGDSLGTGKEAHVDDNQDNICDRCAYEMTRFSVTVPTSLQIAMSPDGDVTTADVGAIVNRSTGAVKVSSLQVETVNGWTLVPYGTDMAHQKVDAKVIGFSIAGTQTQKTGTTESLTLDSRWTIPQDGSLALPYDAVVSACSQPVREQVITLVFVLEWA